MGQAGFLMHQSLVVNFGDQRMKLGARNMIVSRQDNLATKVISKLKAVILVICLFGVRNNAFAATSQVHERIEQLIQTTERQYGIPSGLLAAIAQVESGMNAHAINVKGKAVTSSSSHEAFSLINDARNNGINNIDVGVMQINYRWHGGEFDSIEEMLNPKRNITYAAKLLKSLKARHGTWYQAIKYYHSAKPEYHKIYSRKVVMQWGRKYA